MSGSMTHSWGEIRGQCGVKGRLLEQDTPLRPSVHKKSDFGQVANLLHKCHRVALQLMCKSPLAHRKSIQPVRFVSPRATDLHTTQQGKEASIYCRKYTCIVLWYTQIPWKIQIEREESRKRKTSIGFSSTDSILFDPFWFCLVNRYIGKHLFPWTLWD